MKINIRTLNIEFTDLFFTGHHFHQLKLLQYLFIPFKSIKKSKRKYVEEVD